MELSHRLLARLALPWALAACAPEAPVPDAPIALDAPAADASDASGDALDAPLADAPALDVPAPSDAPTDGGASVAPVACASLDLTPYRSTDCFCGASCQCFLDVPYGPATWREGGRDLAQTLDLYLPTTPAASAPLVFWAHPNGSTKSIGPATRLATDVAVPLLEAGTLFASIEFRHPAVNAAIGAPRTDLASAIQFLRCHAADIGLDAPRMAAVARSRGTLAVWTAVQNDLATTGAGPEATHSTRLRGVWAIAAQTSYWGEWIAEAFFDAASQPLVLAQLGPENHGHAVGDVTADDPPIELRYEDPLPALPLAATDCSSAGGPIDCTHLPAFGDALCSAYAGAGIGGDCHVRYGVASGALLDGAVDFLDTVLAP